MKLAGVDEAGKGPVLGPMVIAGVMYSVEGENINQTPVEMEGLNLRDSKEIPYKKRISLANKIRKTADEIYSIRVEAPQIDELRKIMNMNDILVESYSKVLNNINFDAIVMDAADVNEERFCNRIRKKIEKKDRVMISEHNADDKYPIVSAASIIAKAERDKEIERLEKEIGMDIGSGYPADDITVNFLEKWISEKGNLPTFARKSWSTSKKILENFSQKKFKDFE